ncbi:MAG TPA: SRPBCC family protein [Steroidobacteraceae bacterium]|jgi:uncharacterized protein YndB with AHSA1/START domain
MSLTIKPAAIRKVLNLRATPQRAFEVFTAGIDRWWPRTHHIGKSPLKQVIIEPRVGGRWYSTHEDGSECPWGDVLCYEPPSLLMLAWRINAQFQFDQALLTTVELRFTAVNESETRVDFEHRDLERFGDSEAAGKTREAMGGGWGQILILFQNAANS